MDKLKRVLSGQEDGDGPGVLERASEASTLSCGTRTKCFAFSFILGVLCSVLPLLTFAVFLLLSPSDGRPPFVSTATSRLSRLVPFLFPLRFRGNGSAPVPYPGKPLACPPPPPVSLGSCLLFIPSLGLSLFAVFYSVGNILALASIMFLVGPWRQVRTMCAKERALATVVMLVCLLLTLCAAFWWRNNTLALVFCVLQFLAFTWYGLSYVPFARDAIFKLCTLCF